MSHRPATLAEDLSFVAVAGELADWGVRASLVARVLPRSEWDGDEPLDVAARLGVAPAAWDHDERVIVLVPAVASAALRVNAPMRIRSCRADSVLLIPELVWPDAGTLRLVRELCIVEGDRPLLLLASDAVAALATAPNPPALGAGAP